MSNTDFNNRLAAVAAETEIQLQSLLADTPAEGELARPQRLLAAMRHAVLGGGKRLRPFLVVETAALFGAARDGALLAGAALEFVHCYSLVHDDLPAMDNDDLRRGQPTVHKAFDEATAILAGDALQTRAFEVLADPATHADAAARCELVAALAQASGAAGMAGGQMIDMLAEGRALTAAEIIRLQALKTGRLIQYSAEAGAILGRASPAQRQRLAAYGRDLGAAFQIADDLLDAAGSTGEIGKTAGKDEAAGKATLVSVLGLEQARAQATALADQAAAHLDCFDARADLLRALAAYVVSRRS
jgi:farnesyl diphosphate synthase